MTVRTAGSSWLKLEAENSHLKPQTGSRENDSQRRTSPSEATPPNFLQPASQNWGPSVQIPETCGRYTNYHIEVSVSFNAESNQVTSLLFVLHSGGVFLCV